MIVRKRPAGLPMKTERNRQVVQATRRGLSHRETAKLFNLSRERVTDIVRRYEDEFD